MAVETQGVIVLTKFELYLRVRIPFQFSQIVNVVPSSVRPDGDGG